MSSDDEIPAALAAIDALLHEVLRPVAGAPLGGSVHLHTTDPDTTGEWLVVEEDDGSLTVTREHAKGSCALRGGARDVLAVLQQRSPLSVLDVVGDAEVAGRFVALCASWTA